MRTKIDMAIHVSDRTRTRFTQLASDMRFTREQNLAYLVNLHDRLNPTEKPMPDEDRNYCTYHISTTEAMRMNIHRIAARHGLNHNQVISYLLDLHDMCPRCASSQQAWMDAMAYARDKDYETPANAGQTTEPVKQAPVTASAVKTGAAGNDPVDQAIAALEGINMLIGKISNGNEQVSDLETELTASETETRRIREASQRLLRIAALPLPL